MSSETEGTGATLTSAEPSPEQAALNGELRRLLEQAVETLPHTPRSAFVLREVEGLSTAEAAECLGVTEDVVKTRLHRARRCCARSSSTGRGSSAATLLCSTRAAATRSSPPSSRAWGCPTSLSVRRPRLSAMPARESPPGARGIVPDRGFQNQAECKT